MSILDDADPLRSSLDRHLAQCSTVPSKNNKSDTGETHIGKIRDAHGLCPSCGQQLYRIEQANGGFLACCFGKDDEIKKIPLTIPRLVERGQCLACRGKIKSIGDLSRSSLTETISSSSGSSTKSLLQDFPMASLIEREDESYPGYEKNLKPPPPGSSNPKPPPPGALTDFSSQVSGPELQAMTNEELLNQASLYQISRPASSAPWLPAGTAVYHGPYNDYGQRHGEMGEMIWSNGDVYRGSFVQDYREGHGTLSFAAPHGSVHQDGGEYVGDWHKDQMHGSGTRRYPNGDVYMGDYVKGVRQGQGRFYYANGDLYWGSWQSNQMHGPGRYYYASGQRFEGIFQHGKRTGKGKMQRTDGTLEIFQYVNDQRVGQGVRWSVDRSKAWRLWMPSNGGRTTSHNNKTMSALQKQKMTIAEAVSLVYDIEKAAEASMEGVAWASS